MPRPSTTSAAAHRQLMDACQRTPPRCTGDDRFTADDLSGDEIAYMGRICAACPVRALCADYARAARPEGGFWAARLRTNGKE